MFDGCLDLDVSKRENSTSKCLGGKELTRGLPLVHFSHIVLLGFKYRDHCSEFVAIRLVPRPIGFLTFTGAIRCTSASTAILCFAAFHSVVWGTALWVDTMAKFCNFLHLLVLLIQAGARNAMPEE